MPQNEIEEFHELADGIAGLLRRRRGLGLRRTPALAPPSPPVRARASAEPAPSTAAATYRPPAAKPAEAPAPPAPSPASGAASRAAPSAAPGAAPGAAQPAPAAPGIPDLSRFGSLEELAAAAQDCRACGLAQSRQNVFMSFGTGSSGVLFIDETPGAAADAGGTPFEGPSGELLGNIVTKGMGLSIDAVRLVSLVKCQPAAGAPPEPGELSTCRSWLDRQMAWLDPKVIVTLGRPAATAVLGVEASLGRLRAQVHSAFGCPVVTTYHPDFLVRSPQYKKEAWEDIQLAMKTAGIPLPPRK